MPPTADVPGPPPQGEPPEVKALRACELYYVDHFSQKEIATELGVSAATVSRLLQQARDRGFVRVSICPPPDVALGR
jgi:DNA-binding transcriptional regulator LsrR (DeoR family)